MIAITDREADLYGIDVKHCRYRVRDEQNRVTYVYDRLMGLTSGLIKGMPPRKAGGETE